MVSAVGPSRGEINSIMSDCSSFSIDMKYDNIDNNQRPSSRRLKTASSGLSVLFSLDNIDRSSTFDNYRSTNLDIQSVSMPFEEKNLMGANTCGSFYASYKSELDLPEGYYEVPLQPCASPKINTSSMISSRDLIKALIDYFKSVEAERERGQMSPPFAGSTVNLSTTSLDLLPAEDDGSVMHDLPLFSDSTDILNLGISDFILYNHEQDMPIAHIRIEGGNLNLLHRATSPRAIKSNNRESLTSDDEILAARSMSEECFDGIQVFRTDTEENLALEIERAQALLKANLLNSMEQHESMEDIAQSVRSSLSSDDEIGEKHVEKKSLPAGRMRSSSGSLIISCRRPGSQRWKLTKEIPLYAPSTQIDSPVSPIEGGKKREEVMSPPVLTAAGAGKEDLLPRRHSDRPCDYEEEEEDFHSYVRKWSMHSNGSGGPHYMLNHHTSSATPNFSPSVTNREIDITRSSSIHSVSDNLSYSSEVIDIPYTRSLCRLDAVKTLSRSSVCDQSDLVNVEDLDDIDEFHKVVYTSPGAKKGKSIEDVDLQISSDSGEQRQPTPLYINTNLSTIFNSRTSEHQELESAEALGRSRSSEGSVHPKSIYKTPNTHSQSSGTLFQRFMTSLLNFTNKKEPVKEDDKMPCQEKSKEESTDFESSRESLVRALPVVQDLDTGETYPLGEVIFNNDRLPNTVSPQVLFGNDNGVYNQKTPPRSPYSRRMY